jgi:hypothetical protein
MFADADSGLNSAFLGGLDLKAGDLLQNLRASALSTLNALFLFPLIFCNRAANLKDLLAFLAEKLVGWHITSAYTSQQSPLF